MRDVTPPTDAVQSCSDWLLVTVRIQTAVGEVYMFLLIYSHNDDKKNIKKQL